MQKLVSVIIPIYNAEKTIARCLDALLAQSYENFEVICVNDGSKDESYKILQEYAQKDSRIIALTQENFGPAKARNFAISQSKGEYIMFCDADDWYESEMITEMVTAIERENVDLVMCDCNVIDLANGNIQNRTDAEWCKLKYKKRIELNSKIKDDINCVIWNKIFSKKLIDKYSINYPIKYEHDDAIFFWKYIFASKTYYGLDKKLYNYIIGNPESVSGKYRICDDNPHKYDFILSLQEIFDFIKKTNLPNDYSIYIEHSWGTFLYYYRMLLSEKSKKKAFSLMKKLVAKNIKLLKNNPTYLEFSKIKNYEEFSCKKYKKKCKFIEQIFSCKNSEDKTHKILTILGIKIKFKRK